MSGDPPGPLRREGRLLFIGVSTSGSSILELFPRWAAILGLSGLVEGRDIPLGASPRAHRAAVEEIAAHRDIAGALVTTHKVDVFRHAGDLFDELDHYARLCGEVSCISKRDGRLVGHAKDPITAGLAMDHMLGPEYWVRRAGVLCLGAGGAGTAITVRLLSSEPRPDPIVVADVDPERVEALGRVCEQVGGGGVRLEVIGGSADAARLLSGLPPGSLVINATGMGKDRPGSPLPDEAGFPPEAVVWDLNYRGDLAFLHQARRQQAERALTLHDGWRYFLHGWTEVIAEVYGVELTPSLFDRLARAAQPLRPPTPATLTAPGGTS